MKDQISGSDVGNKSQLPDENSDSYSDSMSLLIMTAVGSLSVTIIICGLAGSSLLSSDRYDRAYSGMGFAILFWPATIVQLAILYPINRKYGNSSAFNDEFQILRKLEIFPLFAWVVMVLAVGVVLFMKGM